MADKPSLLSTHGAHIAYFAAGVLFIGLSRFFLSFWPRFVILTAWGIGLAVMFARVLSRK
ncbi:hypothetical protein [Desulfocurvus sp. DL9XJH121]